MNQIIIESSAG